jgi:hypothetical protein
MQAIQYVQMPKTGQIHARVKKKTEDRFKAICSDLGLMHGGKPAIGQLLDLVGEEPDLLKALAESIVKKSKNV